MIKVFRAILGYLVILLLLGSVFFGTVCSVSAAATTVRVETPQTLGVCYCFCVTISVENVINLAAFQFDVAYDPTVLECTGVYEGKLLSSGGPTFWVEPDIDNNTGIIDNVVCARTGSTGADGSGVLVTITFKTLNVGGSYIEFQNMVLLDPSSQQIPVTTADGNVTVVEGGPVPGDVNNDGRLRTDDSTLSLRIAAGVMVPTSYQKWAADVTGDCNVTISDAILILKKIAGMIDWFPVECCEQPPPPVLSATIDIDPDTLNLRSEGQWITCYIIPPEGYGVSDINVDTILLEDTFGVQHSDTQDGLLMAKFSRQELIEYLGDTTGDVTLVVVGELNDGTLFAGTDVIRVIEADETESTIDEGMAPVKPTEFTVHQNFSNPLNPDTWIPYQLAEDVDVTIRIYDSAGHLVRTLNLGHKPAGFYMTREKAAYWDGRNEAGELVASGIYFYTIQAGEFTATRKMAVKR